MERDDMKCELIKRSNRIGIAAWLMTGIAVLFWDCFILWVHRDLVMLTPVRPE